jgi:DNA-binding NarL/FixJ family response regulator
MSFLHEINNHTIDLILLDIRLKAINGLELFHKLRSLVKQPRVIAVTGLDGSAVIVNLLKSGLDGVVYKLDGYDEIITAIDKVLHAGSYFTKSVWEVIHKNRHQWNEVPSVTFSFQEKELVKGLSNGLTIKEIAASFKMTAGATEKFKLRLIKKVGASNTAGLVIFAYRNGIL